MTWPCLEVTYRKGKPLAAYLHLPGSPGAKSVRTSKVGKGVLVDHDENGSPIGIEITAPESTTVSEVNEVLRTLNGLPMAPEDLAPLPVD